MLQSVSSKAEKLSSWLVLQLAGQNDLESIFPNIALQWHSTRNGNRRPDNVTAFSNLRVWWCRDQGLDYSNKADMNKSDIPGRK
jgi:hypothetical protein